MSAAQLRAARRWLKENRVRRGRSSALAAAAARLRSAQADLAEFDAKARRGKLIPAADVRRVCEKALELFDVGDELGGCAGDIAKMDKPAMIRALLFAEVRRIRRRVAESFAQLALDEAAERR